MIEMAKEINQYMSLGELVKFLPEDRQERIISLEGEGQGLLSGAGFGNDQFILVQIAPG